MKRKLFTYYFGTSRTKGGTIGWRKSAEDATRFITRAKLLELYDKIIIWKLPRKPDDFSY